MFPSTIRYTLASLSLIAAAHADTLLFRNGNRIDGTLISADTQSVRFQVGSHTNTYARSDLESMQFTSGGTASAANSGTDVAPPPPPGSSPAADLAAPPAARTEAATSAASNTGFAIPAGTEIVVRMIDRVDSETDRLGQTYRASVDQPVIVNGQTVVPRGADATTTLIDTQKSGKLSGRAALTLDLKTLVVNGQPFDVVTSGVTQESSSRGARSAKVVGGTAAVGAIIGAIAGGGKGAAIGAGSGAAVGTAAQVVTSGQKVKIPSETRLTFTLQNVANAR